MAQHIHYLYKLLKRSRLHLMGLTMILAALAGLSVVHLMYSTTYTNNLILIASVHTGTAVEPTELVHLTREEYNVKSSIKQNSSWLWGKRSKSMVNDLLKLANDVDKKLEDFNYAAELLNRSKGITTKILINLVTPATEKLRTSSAGGKGKIPREIIDQIGRHNMMKEKDQRSRLTDIANDLELVRRTMQLTIPSKWRQKPDVLKYLPTLKPKRQKNLSKLNNITHASILSGAQVLTSESSVPENVENQSIYGEPGCPDNPDRTVLTIIFQKWIETAKRVNVTYFLSCGTLLGSYRNYDVIPYDTDIDILIDRRDFEKIKSISGRRNFREKDNKFHLVVQEDFYLPYSQRRRFTCKGKLTPVYVDHCSFQEPLGRLIKGKHHLDIYDYTVKGEIIEDLSEGGHIFRKSDIFPLRPCKFMGFQTACPNNPKKILTVLYGEDLAPTTICKRGEWAKRD